MRHNKGEPDRFSGAKQPIEVLRSRIMRFITLSIAILALLTVIYVSFKTPTEAAVYDGHTAAAQVDVNPITSGR